MAMAKRDDNTAVKLSAVNPLAATRAVTPQGVGATKRTVDVAMARREDNVAVELSAANPLAATRAVTSRPARVVATMRNDDVAAGRSVGNPLEIATAREATFVENASSAPRSWGRAARDSAWSLLLFFALSAGTFFTYLSAIALTWVEPRDNGGGGQGASSVWRVTSVWWWNQPPLTTVFLLANLLSCAELTMRFGARKHDRSRSASVLLLLLFVIIVVLFAYEPDAMYREKREPDAIDFDMGNCSDFRRETDQVAIERGKKWCHAFSTESAYVKISEQLKHVLHQNGVDKQVEISMMADGIGVLGERNDLMLLAMTRSYENGDDGMDTTWMHYLDNRCFPLVTQFFCDLSLERCRFTDCQPSFEGWKCAMHVAMQAVSQCAYTVCKTNPEATECERIWALESPLVGLALWVREQLGEEAELLGVPESNAVLIESLLEMAASETKLIHVDAGGQEERSVEEICRAHWTMTDNNANNASSAAAASERSAGASGRLLGCDPNDISYILADGNSYVIDASTVMLVTAAVLCIFIATAGKHQPIIRFETSLARRASLLSLLLGGMASAFIFLGGLSLEKEAAKQTVGAAISHLHAWCVIYYVIAWACMHRKCLIA